MEDYWLPGMKHVFNDESFVRKLLDLDHAQLPGEVFQKVRMIVMVPTFEPNRLGKVSKAAKTLCAWVKAADGYHSVMRLVKPLWEELNEKQEVREEEEEERERERERRSCCCGLFSVPGRVSPVSSLLPLPLLFLFF